MDIQHFLGKRSPVNSLSRISMSDDLVRKGSVNCANGAHAQQSVLQLTHRII